MLIYTQCIIHGSCLVCVGEAGVTAESIQPTLEKQLAVLSGMYMHVCTYVRVFMRICTCTCTIIIVLN